MSFIKEMMAEKEKKQRNKLNGYRKMKKKSGLYNMECPYCSNALSDYDAGQDQCVHCGYEFPWKK